MPPSNSVLQHANQEYYTLNSKNGSAIPISLTTRRCVTFSTIALALVGESWRPIYSLKTQVVTRYDQLYICRGQIEL